MGTHFTRFPVGVYLFFGRKRMGKTHLQREMIKQMIADGRTVALIHDSRGQYPGAKVWATAADFRNAEHLEPINLFTRERATAVVALAVELAEAGERVLLVIDEMDQLCRSNQWFDDPPTQRGAEPEHGNTFNVCHYGRHIGRPIGDTTSLHYGVTLLGSARRPTNVHVDLGELGERYFFFSMTGRNSIRWVDDTTDAPSIAAAVHRLPPRHYIEWSSGEEPKHHRPIGSSASSSSSTRRPPAPASSTRRSPPTHQHPKKKRPRA